MSSKIGLTDLDAELYSTITGPKGAIKSIQRGVTSAAGTVTINAVDVSKSVISSVSKGSAGYVAARGTVAISAASISTSGKITAWDAYQGGTTGSSGSNYSSNLNFTSSGTIAAHNGTLSGGTTDLTTKQYSAVLTNSTTITCDGPVEWQLIEYL